MQVNRNLPLKVPGALEPSGGGPSCSDGAARTRWSPGGQRRLQDGGGITPPKPVRAGEPEVMRQELGRTSRYDLSSFNTLEDARTRTHAARGDTTEQRGIVGDAQTCQADLSRPSEPKCEQKVSVILQNTPPGTCARAYTHIYISYNLYFHIL